MNIIDIPLGKDGEFSVDESAGVFTIEVKAELLGTPECETSVRIKTSVFAFTCRSGESYCKIGLGDPA